MKSEAFRDDLASRAFAGITVQDVRKFTFPDATPLRVDGVSHPIGYIGGGTDREWRFTHTDGSQFFKADPAPGESYGVWAMQCAEEAERNATRGLLFFTGRRHGKSFFSDQWSLPRGRHFETMWLDEADEIPLPAWFQLTPSKPAIRDHNQTLQLLAKGAREGCSDRYLARFTESVRTSDRPGIAAMAAKNVQPQPEPVLSIGGQKTTEREITEALALLRGQNAPAVKETPRGLMTVAAMDHRLGRWNEV